MKSPRAGLVPALLIPVLAFLATGCIHPPTSSSTTGRTAAEGAATGGSSVGYATSRTAALVVASDLENPPFALVGDDGEPRGRDVEMMVALGRLLDRPLRWERMPFDRLLDSVERGHVDVVCATLGVTPERAERVAFTRPYFDTEIVAVVRVGSGEPRSLDELGGRRVTAGLGTTSERAVRRRIPGAHLELGAKSELTTLERLVLGEIDAAVMDGPNADALVAQGGGSLTRIAEALDHERYALALPRGETVLRDQLDEALAELQARGVLASLDQVYGLVPAR